jgi:triosephosphate isomerase
MHKTVREAVSFVEELGKKLETDDVEAVICPPSPLLSVIAESCRKYGISLGAQNMHWETSGAYTGEISPVLLKDLGVSYVVVGHSERRQLFFETDQHVCRKVNAAFDQDLIPIVCVGESLQQHEAGATKDIVKEQVTNALNGLDPSRARKVVIAYEPIWAIGSGLAATAGDAGEVAQWIRKTIGDLFSLKVARDMRIQYGGSVKPENIREFMNEADIDGALVGGASLDPADFACIIHSALGVAPS